MLITGTLDAINPVHNAREVARTLRNATVIAVDGAQHEALTIDVVQRAVLAFLGGKAIAATTLTTTHQGTRRWQGPSRTHGSAVVRPPATLEHRHAPVPPHPRSSFNGHVHNSRIFGTHEANTIRQAEEVAADASRWC